MKKSIGYVVFILGVAIILGVFFADVASGLVYEESPFNNNIVDAISFFVAIIAFIFSAITYFSIDSMNSITAMTGSVLENQNYTITYSRAVSQFATCKNKKEYTDCLFDVVNFDGKTKTCMEFADILQRVIDNLVWFNYIDVSDDENVRRLDAIIEKLIKEGKRYSKLSNGINYLLDENINLIKYVFEYQRNRYDKEIHICALEDIRGEMLVNPVARIVYYNYLGLDYRRQASRLLDIEGKGLQDFLIENEKNILRYISEDVYSEKRLEKIDILLKRAHKCFDRALALANDNIIWEGSIMFNIVRADVTQFLLGQSDMTGQQIVEEYNKVISKRAEEQYLFFDDNVADVYLCERYRQRYNRVLVEKEAFLRVTSPNTETAVDLSL